MCVCVQALNRVELVESDRALRFQASMWAGAWMEEGVSPRFQKQGRVSVYDRCTFEITSFIYIQKIKTSKAHKGATSCKPQPRQSKRTILMIPDKIVRQNILQGAMKLYITVDGSIERIKWEASALVVEAGRRTMRSYNPISPTVR